jgi:hypothetical protein
VGRLSVNKLAGADAAAVLQRCHLPPEPRLAIQGLSEIAPIVDELVKSGFMLEAVRVFAHALPKREAVWWACMCAQATAPGDLNGPDLAARQAAEAWVRTQADETRRVAMAQARMAGMRGPDAWAGVAAFWSGESLMPAGNPVVPPPPHLTGVAVSGAVALSSVRITPKRQAARLDAFIASARDIAAGGSGRLPPETS